MNTRTMAWIGAIILCAAISAAACHASHAEKRLPEIDSPTTPLEASATPNDADSALERWIRSGAGDPDPVVIRPRLQSEQMANRLAHEIARQGGTVLMTRQDRLKVSEVARIRVAAQPELIERIKELQRADQNGQIEWFRREARNRPPETARQGPDTLREVVVKQATVRTGPITAGAHAVKTAGAITSVLAGFVAATLLVIMAMVEPWRSR